MADIGQTDFSQKNQVDLASVASLYQRKPVLEQEMATQREQQKTMQSERILNITKMASEMTTNLIQYNAKKQMQTSAQAISEIMSKPNMTEEDIARAKGLAVRAFPKDTGETLTKQLFSKPEAPDMGKPQQGSLELKDGTMVAATFKQGKYYYPNTETLVPPEKISGRGYGLVPVTNADGSVSYISRTTASRIGTIGTDAMPIPESKIGSVTSVNDPLLQGADRKDVISKLIAVRSDPAVKNAVKMVPMLDNVERYLKEDNKVAIDRLGGLTQKMIALDSGNLAAWEQRDPGSREYIERLKQFASMSTKGTLSKNNKEELVKVLTITRDNLKTNVEASAEAAIDNLVETYPQLNKEAMYKKTGVDKILKYTEKKDQVEQDPMAQMNAIAAKLDAMEKRRNAERR